MERTVWILAVVLGAFVMSAEAGESHKAKDMKATAEKEMQYDTEAFEAEPAAGPYEEYDEYAQDGEEETMQKSEGEKEMQ